MIDEHNEVQQRNIKLLFEGYWYEDFQKNQRGVICEFKNTKAPSYIFNDGIEPITFLNLRRMVHLERCRFQI